MSQILTVTYPPLLRHCSHRGPHRHFCTQMTLPQQISIVSSLKSFPSLWAEAQALGLGSFSCLSSPAPLVPLPPGWLPGCHGGPLSLRLPASSSSGPSHRGLLPLLPEAPDPTGHLTLPSCLPFPFPVMVLACFLSQLCPVNSPLSAIAPGIYAQQRFAD